MNRDTENTVLLQLKFLIDEFASFRKEVGEEFASTRKEFDDKLKSHHKELNDEVVSFRIETNKRFDSQDDRITRLEETTHRHGILLEDTANRMELAGEGIDSIVESIQRLTANYEVRKSQEPRLSAVEIWSKDHQRAYDDGKL